MNVLNGALRNVAVLVTSGLLMKYFYYIEQFDLIKHEMLIALTSIKCGPEMLQIFKMCSNGRELRKTFSVISPTRWSSKDNGSDWFLTFHGRPSHHVFLPFLLALLR